MTTKDCLKGRRELHRNLPCVPGGSRAPAQLAATCWQLFFQVPLRSKYVASSQSLLLAGQLELKEEV